MRLIVAFKFRFNTLPFILPFPETLAYQDKGQSNDQDNIIESKEYHFRIRISKMC